MIVSKKVKIIKCYINCISKGKTTIQENSHGVKYKFKEKGLLYNYLNNIIHVLNLQREKKIF